MKRWQRIFLCIWDLLSPVTRTDWDLIFPEWEIARSPESLQQLVVGVINGAIIAIIALGYTLVYGIIELINFAHGDLYMLGAFAG